ncbi:MarR family transcriptional regulator [Mycobacterium sp.]|uniref:MarR family transcriptional regulator n=1 Tax=Mycobacterium sp. TaxID=1785 RepID=UPI003D09C423
MTELAVLQAVRLKGRVGRDDLTATLREEVGPTVDGLVEAGLLADGPTLRISPEGRVRLEELLTSERQHVDADAVLAAYDEFRSVNAEFKALVTDWQLRDSQPNNHDDADYDAAVLTRLDEVHHTAMLVVNAVAAELPRLSRYAAKLQTALDRVRAGETMWLSRPLMDSYHTVWFELHEELILAAGLTREAEDA